MRPISLFAGFISLRIGLFWKLSLWSFSVMNACHSAMRSVWSSMFMLVAMFLASLLIALMVLALAFLLVDVMLSMSSLSCVVLSTS